MIKSLLSHKIPSQNMGEVLEILFDQYLNKNPITMKSKEHNKTTSITPEPPSTESSSSKNLSCSKSLSNQKTSCSHSQSIITKRFMDARNTSKSRESMEVQESENSSGINTKTTDHHNNTERELLGNIATSAMKNNLNLKNSKRSRYIPIHIRRRVFERANHCCEFTGSNEERCQSRSQLELDHFIKPYSQGGDHSWDNLKLHCSQHNLYRASRMGIGFETINANL